MTVHVILLRAVNLGARNKVGMPRLRELLTQRGFHEPRTLLASGNVLLLSDESADEVAGAVHQAIADEWGLDIATVTRTPEDLRAVLAAGPIPGAADDAKLYRVRFLAEPAGSAFDHLDPAAFPGEKFVIDGREVYAWMPQGTHDSRLSRALASPRIGLVSTERNWDTVIKIAALAAELEREDAATR